MIKNKKGFVITEVLILTTVIMGVLVFMYAQFKSINRNYQYSLKYDTPEGLYLANNIINYINENRYDYLVSQLTLKKNGYIDITNCEEKIYGLLGDINNDGFINSIDASNILNLISKVRNNETLTDNEKIAYNKSDINEDGIVDEEDANIVLHNYTIISTSNYNTRVTNETKTFCKLLFNKSNIKQILFTKEDTNQINTIKLDQDLKEYIKQIQTKKSENDYRIIIKYNNETFATMRFNKENTYVKEGLVAYLDGINNTGNGHSNDTTIWKDLSNNGNDATLYNNPTWSNNSITFNGLTNYALLNNTANQVFLNGITLETRVNILSFTGTNTNGHIEYFGNWQEGGGGFIFQSDYKNTPSFKNIPIVDTTITSNLNEYYTVTATYDNNTLKWYINGELVSTVPSNSGEITVSHAPFGIGGNPSQSNTIMDCYANAKFQNLLIYDRALTENEVMRNYQTDIARY